MNPDIYKQLIKITQEESVFLNGQSESGKERYTVVGQLVVNRYKIIDNGKLIQIRPHPRFVHFPVHTHKYVEMVYMYSGQTTHIINGNTVTLKKGELLFLSQKASQEILPAGENDLAINFIIEPDFFDLAISMSGGEENLIRNYMIRCLKGEDKNIQHLHFKVSDILPIQNLVENLIWAILDNQNSMRSINPFTMGVLFIQLVSYSDKLEVSEDYYEQDLLLVVYRFVEEHYMDGELSDLARELGCDLYWLSRRVKKLTGHTYTELVQSKRLSKAQFLLQTTNLSIAEIGMAVGYDNLSYFHHIFREKNKTSPKQWRKMNKIT